MEQSGGIPRERLQQNLEKVRAHVAEAAAKAGRAADAVTLLAVTKTVGLAEIQTLMELGVRDFGESRIQDGERKIRACGDRQPIPTQPGGGGQTANSQTTGNWCQSPNRVNWHLIGHLQTNKADKAAKLFQAMHAVDSLRIAQALNKERLKATLPPLPCLFEINVAGEAQKYGLPPEVKAVGELLRQCTELPGLKVVGLMCMAPYAENAEAASRPVFRRLRELLAEANATGHYPTALTELSMGMSQDYGIAVEEGATMVRVGSALFE
jgi:pyridoxal phosphate enzyme (YggS family)